MIKTIMSCWVLLFISTIVKAESTIHLLPEETGITFNKQQPEDYYVPDDTMLNTLTVTLRGGDGGYRYGYPLDFSGEGGWNLTKKTYYGRGGGGATIINSFKVGHANDEINPGAILRFIPGGAGSSNNSLIHAAGGGGGGSALLMKRHVTDSEWIILAVAGGGSGAAGGTSDHSSNHGGNGVSWEASCLEGECDNRVCSGYTKWGAGGGAFTINGDLMTGRAGYPSGAGKTKYDGIVGGFGFGSGGARNGTMSPSGGGGGYCGGLPGRNQNEGGYGGSSYINPQFAQQVDPVRSDGVANYTTTSGYINVILHDWLLQDDFENFPVNIVEAAIEEKNDVVSLTQGHFEAVIGKEDNLVTANLLKSASLTDVSYLLLDPENPMMQLYHEELAYPEHIVAYREAIMQCATKVTIDHASFTTTDRDLITVIEMSGQYQAEGTLALLNAEDVANNNAAPVIECETAGEVSTIDSFASIHYDRWEKELTLEPFIVDGAILFYSNLKLGAFN